MRYVDNWVINRYLGVSIGAGFKHGQPVKNSSMLVRRMRFKRLDNQPLLRVCLPYLRPFHARGLCFSGCGVSNADSTNAEARDLCQDISCAAAGDRLPAEEFRAIVAFLLAFYGIAAKSDRQDRRAL